MRGYLNRWNPTPAFLGKPTTSGCAGTSAHQSNAGLGLGGPYTSAPEASAQPSHRTSRIRTRRGITSIAWHERPGHRRSEPLLLGLLVQVGDGIGRESGEEEVDTVAAGQHVGRAIVEHGCARDQPERPVQAA